VSEKIELTKKDSEHIDGKCTSEGGNERNIFLKKIGDLPQYKDGERENIKSAGWRVPRSYGIKRKGLSQGALLLLFCPVLFSPKL